MKSIFSSPDGKSYVIPFMLVTSLFLMWGLAHGLLDVLNKHFQVAFTMSKAQSGLFSFHPISLTDWLAFRRDCL